MRYRHRFTVRAPIEVVAAFHSRPAAMAIITPPPLLVQMARAPERLASGDTMAFTLWLGPLPLRWESAIEDVTATGFVDRALQGPVRFWRHRHSFEPVDHRTTAVLDEVEIELRAHPIWGPIGLAMAWSLPLLFAYRSWQTRRLLDGLREPGQIDFAGWQAEAQRTSVLAALAGIVTVTLGALAGLGKARRR
jgi:ligand-binding SRPBCC domain-containing protein